MKILQVCAIDVSVKRLLKPLIDGLVEQGFEVASACLDTGEANWLRKQGYVIHDIPFRRKMFSLKNIVACWKLYRLLKKEKFDIIHVHTPVAAVIGRIAAVAGATPHIVYTAHGFYFHEGMSPLTYRFFYWIEKFFATQFTDWLLLQSIEDYQLSVERKFLPEEQIVHLSNGVDVETKFNPKIILEEEKTVLREEFNLTERDVVLCFMGRFVKEKGIVELMDAFELLHQEYPEAKLLLLGELLESDRKDDAYSNLTQRIEKHPAVIAPGIRDDIPQILAISDIFTLPSYREGLPRSIIEAMAMGLPVVATNIRGCREEVEEGVTGYLVEKQNVEDLAEKLDLLLEHRTLRESFGLKARMRAELLFNEAAIIQKQVDLFRSFGDVEGERDGEVH
ncbi:glycosyltransferase family 4 protein [Thalassobacillus hwangdonensis]|uniref:Glycosyltransferase family 4 protein n=1 Tax=Thalassobacillus hwangdonensis TaxID=546108 RepID=A0ABW3L5D0_9BACI